MNMKQLNGVDVSSFLLVEESADSEGDFLTWEMCGRDIGAAAAAEGGGEDDDDAESCSCDTAETLNIHGDHEAFNYDVDIDQDNIVDIDDDHDGELCWSSTPRCCELWLGYMSTEEGEEEESSRAGFKTKVRDDEMEDRVFWETCMAVGYP